MGYNPWPPWLSQAFYATQFLLARYGWYLLGGLVLFWWLGPKVKAHFRERAKHAAPSAADRRRAEELEARRRYLIQERQATYEAERAVFLEQQAKEEEEAAAKAAAKAHAKAVEAGLHPPGKPHRLVDDDGDAQKPQSLRKRPAAAAAPVSEGGSSKGGDKKEEKGLHPDGLGCLGREGESYGSGYNPLTGVGAGGEKGFKSCRNTKKG